MTPDIIKNFIEKGNRLPQPLRIFILSLGVIVISFSWYFTSYSAYGAKNKEMSEKHEVMLEKISNIKSISNDKDKFVYESNLIASEDLSSLLETLLENSSDLELISLQKQNKKPLSKGKDDDIKGLHEVLGQNISAHDIEVTLSGSYFALLKYLQGLKMQDSNGIFWKDFNYQVKKYPKAEIKMVLRTLSKG